MVKVFTSVDLIWKRMRLNFIWTITGTRQNVEFKILYFETYLKQVVPVVFYVFNGLDLKISFQVI